MKNSDLLKTPNMVLTEIQRQNKYCLEIDLTPVSCPACGVPVNQIDAAGVPLDEWDASGATSRPTFHCRQPDCGARLVVVVPFMTSGPKYQWKLDTAWMKEQLAQAKAFRKEKS
jgi:hypothetical protein